MGRKCRLGTPGSRRWLVANHEFEGSRFDVGPHRFFTKNQEVHALFVKTVAEDLLNVPRLTRIFYNNTYFNYPLTPLNALFGVGILSSISILSSYTMTRAGPRPRRASHREF